jgi:hypothetical protein
MALWLLGIGDFSFVYPSIFIKVSAKHPLINELCLHSANFLII